MCGLVRLAGILLAFLPAVAWAGCVGAGSGCAAFVPAVVAAKALGDPGARDCGGTPAPSVRLSDGDQVALSTGNRFMSVTDYLGTGPFALRLAHYYNSQDEALSWFGQGWRLSYMRALSMMTDGVVHAVRDDGRVLVFTRRAGRWVSDADVGLSLLQLGAPGGRRLWLLRGCDGSVETYTPDGRLLGITNHVGLRQSLAYDTAGRLVKVTDPAGRALIFSFGGSTAAPAVSVTAPDGGVTIYGFDDQHRLISITHPDGSKLGFSYASIGPPLALTVVTDELGNAFSTVSYDSSGRVRNAALAGAVGTVAIDASNVSAGSVIVTNALGGSEETAFDMLAGSVVRTGLWRDCTGTCAGYYTTAPFTTSYDASANRLSTIDFIGNRTSFTFDPATNLEISRTEAVGQSYARTITTSWNSQYRRPLTITRPGRTVSNSYDANGNLLSRTISAGNASRVWRNSYNQSGQRLTRTDPRGNVTSYAYDPAGDLVSITNALGQVRTFSGFDASGRPTGMTDPNMVSGSFAYDVRGHLVARGFGGATETWQYDATGELVRHTAGDGSYLLFTHDAAHRLIGITDALGNSIAFTLDAAGNRSAVRISDATGVARYQHSYQHDAFNRLISDSGASGQVTNYAYNYDDSLALVTDPLGHARLISIDELGRRLALVDPAGAATRLLYDALDHLVGVTDARGNSSAFLVDGFDDLQRAITPDGGTSSLAYDANGNQVGRTDARGASSSTSFDALNRPLLTSYAAASAEAVSRAYDNCPNGIGRLCAMDDPAGTLSLSYDQRGNVAATTRTIGGISLSCTFGFDLADHIAAITYPSGLVVRYLRDAMGRVIGINATSAGGAPVSVLSGVQYQPFGRPIGWAWFNRVSHARVLDLDGRVSTIADTIGGTARLSLTYGRDLAGQVTTITDHVAPANSQSFSHDVAGRLISATGNYGTAIYSFDAVGNRLSDPVGNFTIPAGNDLPTTITDLSGAMTMQFTYDAAGDLLSMTPAGGTAVNFSYAQSGRLASVSSGANLLARFLYDGFGRRVIKADASGTVALFVNDPGGHLLEETDGFGIARYDLIWLDDEPVARFDPGSGNFYAVHTDARGAVVMLTDAAGAVVWQASYQPFGALATLSGVLTQNLRLAGQYADSESGLYRNGARDYLPATGRYLEAVAPSTIAPASFESSYVFAKDMPLDLIEPDGGRVRPVAP